MGALDDINYARWTPAHIKDMKCVPETLQTTLKKCWVILKSSRKKFSNMPKEKAHEQNNSILKG